MKSKIKFDGRRPSRSALLKQHDSLRAQVQSLPRGRGSEGFKARLLASLDHDLKSSLRGYGKMVVGVHPSSGERIYLGYADIYIFGEGGKVYKAPNMLYHYVTVHHYKPPDEFIQALKHAACPPEPEYLEHLKRVGFSARFVDAYREMWRSGVTQKAHRVKSGLKHHHHHQS